MLYLIEKGIKVKEKVGTTAKETVDNKRIDYINRAKKNE
jgi:hypothetical protein